MINRFRNNVTDFFLKAAAGLAGCFFLLACENDLATIRDLQKNKLTVDEVMGVESYMSQAGVMRAKLTAPYMLR